MDIKNLPAIVTGGASGMGRVTAQRLAELGAKVAVLDVNEAAVNKAAAEINGLGIVADVTDEISIQTALNKTIKKFGVPRIVVNCAGILDGSRMCGKQGPMPLADFKQVINVNLVGTFNVMRLTADKMLTAEPVNADGERGVIINTASIAAFEGQIGQVSYSASKGGVSSMTLPAARELAKFGIRVVAIAPGLIDTPMLEGVSAKLHDALLATTQFPKRLGLPIEFANFVVHIVNNPLFNGATLRIDGAVRLPS